MGGEKETPEIFGDSLLPKIFQTFRMAIQPGKLIIALSALAVITLAGWIMDFSRTVVATPGTQGEVTELQIYMTNPDHVQSYIEAQKQTSDSAGVFSTLLGFTAARFKNAINSLFAFNLPAVAANIAECFKAAIWAVRYHFIYTIIFLDITLAVISIAGGSLCRIAALQFAKGEKPGLTEALGFGIKKFMSFFTSPLAPIGIIVFIGAFIFLLGLVGNIPRAGELIMGIFMPLALIAGALIAVVLIGAVAGFNLMFPAVAYEGSDCFDAISRSFSYVYAKPWRMGFYTAIAVVYGAICYTFVRFFAFLLLLTTRWFLLLGVWVKASDKQLNKLTSLWPEPSFANLLGSPALSTANWSESLAGLLVYLFVLVVIGLVVSFVISFYFSANTIIYAALRNRVDNTVLEEIYTSSGDDQAEPTATGPESEQKPPGSERQPKS